jgi:hypothetical protein
MENQEILEEEKKEENKELTEDDIWLIQLYTKHNEAS